MEEGSCQGHPASAPWQEHWMNVLPETQLLAGPQTALARPHPHCHRNTIKTCTNFDYDQRENIFKAEYFTIIISLLLYNHVLVRYRSSVNLKAQTYILLQYNTITCSKIVIKSPYVHTSLLENVMCTKAVCELMQIKDWSFIFCTTYFGKVRLRSSLTNCGLPVLTGRLGSLAPAIPPSVCLLLPRRLRTEKNEGQTKRPISALFSRSKAVE